MDNDISLFHNGYSSLYVCGEMVDCETSSPDSITSFGKTIWVSAGPLTALASVCYPDLAVTAQDMSQLLVDHNLPTEIDHKQGNRGYEENVDEHTHRKAGPQPKQPQKDQY
jgi:hypothetical protein